MKEEEKTNSKEKTQVPTYNTHAQIKCSCGNVFTVGSTVSEMQIEICSACHPYYTGQEKVMDIAGRVERYKTRLVKFQKQLENKNSKVKPTKKSS